MATQTPYLVIKPRAGWQALNLMELWTFRDLLMTLATRDVKLRYRQTALGASWVVLQPLLGAGIFSFVFGKVAKLPSDGIPYFIFSYAGLLGWNAFSATLGKASASLLANAGLVSKIYFPRLILPISTLFSSVIDFLVAFAVMLVLLIVYHITPGIGILLLPFLLALTLLLALGIALFASAMMVTYRDVQYILPVMTQFLQYASPVAYAVSAVPARLQAAYFLNPLAGLLDAFRWSLLGRGELRVDYLLYATIFTFVVLLSGASYFKKVERRFADVI